MAWLMCGERVLASLEIPVGRRDRAKGLIGRDTYEGAMLLNSCRSVHTVGMRFGIDVAFLDESNCVIDIVTVQPRRVTMPRMKAKCVIEARAGSFERWGLSAGDEIEIKA